jgi:hypothetical protein
LKSARPGAQHARQRDGNELVMKQAQGIVNRYAKSGVARQAGTSIALGLQQALTTQEFVDLVSICHR